MDVLVFLQSFSVHPAGRPEIVMNRTMELPVNLRKIARTTGPTHLASEEFRPGLTPLPGLLRGLQGQGG